MEAKFIEQRKSNLVYFLLKLRENERLWYGEENSIFLHSTQPDRCIFTPKISND